MSQAVQIQSGTIRRLAAERLAGKSVVSIFFHQAWVELSFLARKHINFRQNQNAEAVRAYTAMTIADFEGINARQRWANWRTIPKNLNGRLPNRPCVAMDLCCGVGQSTEVLACYLPEGSTVLGLEYNPKFVETASRKAYRSQKGNPVSVTFRAQSVLETFRDGNGNPISNESVDLVNSCGAIGFHFDAPATRVIVDEIARVLKRGGLATIDSGAPGTHKDELIQMFQAHGFVVLNQTKSCIVDIYTQICFQKPL